MELHGYVAEGYGKVADAFAANFAERDELGAGFALHVGGELVVDLHAGAADRDGTAWSDRTLQLVFSTTKGVAAICVGMLRDRGLVDLDEAVSTYWPEFAAHGKGQLTVGQLMSHQAGIPAYDADLSFDEVMAVAPVTEALADQVPLWVPGTAHGYHALTYGWLVGELVRRVDGRRINAFLQDEVCGPLGAEFWMGLPEEHDHRVARLQPAPLPSDPAELQRMIERAGPGTLGGRALFLDGMFAPGAEHNFNERAVRATEMPGANGITNARSLSRIYAATVTEVDGVRLLTDDTVDAMRAERVRGPDACLLDETRFGSGFWLDNSTAPMLGPGAFGHPGAGGSLGYADPETGVGYGYLMNQMGNGIAGDPRTLALNDAVRACLG
ncbi:MAG: serine hydrolase domain-containing protein [Actinomycetota bacterium]